MMKMSRVCLRADYDDLVAQTGCSGSVDTLACLRTVPYAKLKAAQDASPFFLSYQVEFVLALSPKADTVLRSHWFSLGCPEKMAFS